MFGKIHLWSHLFRTSAFWEIFITVSNLFTSDWSIQIFYFFMIQSWKVVWLIWIINPFLLDCPNCCCIAIQSILLLIILCIYVVAVVISPLSFLILFIWAFSLFFLVSIAKNLSILFIFSKNQLLVSLIFSIVFLVCISFISALIHIISSFYHFDLCLVFVSYLL